MQRPRELLENLNELFVNAGITTANPLN